MAKVLEINVGYLFNDTDEGILSITSDSELDFYKKEVDRLQTLLNRQKKSTKVIVEIEVDDDEFIKMGLKDKVIQVLDK